MTTEQIIVEIVADTTSLETAIQQLVKTGAIDQQLASSFKTTTAEINKQAQAVSGISTNLSKQTQQFQGLNTSIKPVSTSLQAVTEGFNKQAQASNIVKQTAAELNKEATAAKAVGEAGKTAAVTLEDIANATKSLNTQFQQGFMQGIREALDEAGVSMDEFIKRLGQLNQGSPFAQLSTAIEQAKKQVAATAAEIEKMKSSGNVDTEGFAKLEEQLKIDQAELAQVRQELGSLAGAFDGIPEGADKATASTTSLKKELRLLTEQITQAKVSGKDVGSEYEALVQKAGKLKDAIGDANQEISNTASDTSKIDGLIQGVQGVAGAFAIAQGASALFGEESEDVQRALVKLNAVMAIMQGLQAASNAVLKESGFIRLFTAEATNKQTIAQKLYNLVVGQSTGALKGFKIALASTGIGLLIIALGALIANWDAVKEAIFGVSAAQKELAENADLNADQAEEQLEAMEGQEEVLKRQGKSEAQILQAKVDQVNQIIEYRKQQLQAQIETTKGQVEAAERNKRILAGIITFLTLPLKGLQLAFNKIAEAIGSDFRIPDIGETISSLIFDPDEVKDEGDKTIAETQKEIDKLENQKAGFQNKLTDIHKAAAEQRLKDQVANVEKQLLQVEVGSKRELDLQKKLINAKAAVELAAAKTQAEQELINAKRLKDLAQVDLGAERAKLSSSISTIELQLQAAEKGSRQELRLKQDLIQKKAELEITSTELTEKQKQDIIAKSNQEQLALAKQYNEQLAAEAIENAISLNNAELAGLQEGASARLQLLLSNIDLSAQAEIAAAKGNAAKIKEIYANRDRDIRDTTIRLMEEARDREIEQLNRRQAYNKGVLQAIVSDERQSVHERIDALEELKKMDLALLDIRLKSLKALHAKQLISDDDFASQYGEILGQIANVEKKNSDDTKAIIDKNTQGWINLAIEGLNQVNAVFQSLGDIQAQKDADRIAGMKKTLQDELEAGAITEKEGKARAKRIEAEEKKMRQKQAEREKSVALFGAILNMAKAITNMLATNPGPQAFVAAAIAAAAAAAQVALIASKPIPKFKTGKKHLYEGLAEVAEDNQPEIIERHRGSKILVKKKSLVWLGKQDKVYTHKESVQMLDNITTNTATANNTFNNNHKNVRANTNITSVNNGKVHNNKSDFITWLGDTNNKSNATEIQKIIMNSRPAYVVNKQAMSFMPNSNGKFDELKASIDNLHKTMKSKGGVTVNVDKEGITEYFEKTMSEIHYFNNRYTFRGK